MSSSFANFVVTANVACGGCTVNCNGVFVVAVPSALLRTTRPHTAMKNNSSWSRFI